MTYLNSRVHILAIIILCVFFSNCNKKKKIKINIGDIKNDLSFSKIIIRTKECHNLSLSTLVKNIAYIKLQTKDNALIGNVDKLLITDDKIFVSDFYVAKSIFIFNDKGDFLFKLESGIKAKFSSITDVAVSEERRQLFVLSNNQKRVFVFSFNGMFVNSIKLPAYFDHIEIVKAGILLLRESNKFNHDVLKNSRLCLFSWAGELQKAWLTQCINPYINYDTPINPIVSSFGNATIIRSYQDNIYSFSSLNEQLSIKYNVLFDGSSIEKRATTSSSRAEFEEFKKHSKYEYILGNVFDMPNYLIFMYTDDKEVNYFFKDKRANKEYLINRFDNNIDFVPVSPFMFSHKNYLASVIPASDVKSEYDLVYKHDPKGLRPDSKKILEIGSNVTETDNPFIVKYYFN